MSDNKKDETQPAITIHSDDINEVMKEVSDWLQKLGAMFVIGINLIEPSGSIEPDAPVESPAYYTSVGFSNVNNMQLQAIAMRNRTIPGYDNTAAMTEIALTILACYQHTMNEMGEIPSDVVPPEETRDYLHRLFNRIKADERAESAADQIARAAAAQPHSSHKPKYDA